MQTPRRPTSAKPNRHLPNSSIHPNGRLAAKAGATTKPRRKREPTEAHRRHVKDNPQDAMSAARLSKLDSGAA